MLWCGVCERSECCGVSKATFFDEEPFGVLSGIQVKDSENKASLTGHCMSLLSSVKSTLSLCAFQSVFRPQVTMLWLPQTAKNMLVGCLED